MRSRIADAAARILRRPYVPMSVLVHAALLALMYYVGGYPLEQSGLQTEVASSLRATDLAGAARHLQQLEAIKRLLENSTGRPESPRETDAVTPASPQTPEEMVQRARELSSEIDALDEQIKAEELARLTGAPAPPSLEARVNGEKAPKEAVTPERAANEVAALEARARAALLERRHRLDAKENGVRIEQPEPGPGKQAIGGMPSIAPKTGRRSTAAARREIADFIGGAGGRSDEMTLSETYANLDFFHDGAMRIPPVDAGSLVPGQGRMIGAGGEYANRVYLDTWYIIGPFAGRHGGGLFDNPSYPPEKAVLLDAVYYGKDQRVLKWRYFTAPRYPLVPPDPAEDSVYYGYTEVFVDRDCDLIAWIGADDDVQIWLNDRMVWQGGNVNKRPYFDAVFVTRNTYLRDYNRSEGRRVLHFEQGRNRIFFKLSNGPNNPFLSMVLTR